MSTLVSPGVSVQIIDESFYGGAGPGTIPLIVLVTATNKTSPSGSGIAPATVPNQAGSLFLATSQRELIQNFGTPSFKTVQGTPVQGYELNEYGLLAAYQYLGISSRCYVLRANIDLDQLAPSTTSPVSVVPDGTYWLDLSSTSFGIFQSNGNQTAGLAWASQPTLSFSHSDIATGGGPDAPASNFGTDGDFTVVTTQSDNIVYERINGGWYKVGSSAWKAKRPTTITGRSAPNSIAPLVDTIIINSITVAFDQIPDGTGGFTSGTGALAEIVTAINASTIPHITASISGSGALEIRNTIGGSISINNGSGTALTTLGITAKTYVGVDLYQTNNAQYPANSAYGSVWIKGSYPNNGASWTVKLFSSSTGWTTINAPFYPFNSMLLDGVASKDQAANTAFGIPSIGTVYVGYDSTNGTQQLRRWTGSMWTNLIYEASVVEPFYAPDAGTYWYNADFKADIMYGDGTQWLGYARKFTGTDPNGVIISGSKPTTQSDGVSALVDNDLWIDSSDTENYPMLYRYAAATKRWNLIDKTDDTSPFGIVFADARQDSGTDYANNNGSGYNFGSTMADDLVRSNFVDPDAPEPRAYPDGMLLFNTRASTYNVKEWKPNYFEAGNYSATDYTMHSYTSGNSIAEFPSLSEPGRWVTASGNATNGAPYMGRKAQRVMVTRAMESVIQTNEDIRSELVYFNLIASPGYPELIPQMVSLNQSMFDVAFVVGDTPIRLQPSGTAISNWAKNAKNVASTGEDGLTLSSEYVGLYYPWGLSVDLSGNEVMVPPSSIALCSIAYNDQVAYPWYAPAGFTRGLVTNASTVGYLTSGNDYQPVILNQGQRDTLYTNNINPIAYIVGRGLVVYGQKTLQAGSTSAMDRVNVVRLVNYLSYNLDNILKPFLFEQNDSQTQSAVTAVVTNFLNGLVSLQGITDYAVVCDATNNTSQRVSANQLWVDIAIIPVNSIEFIYIPVRILNAGQSLATAVSSTIQL